MTLRYLLPTCTSSPRRAFSLLGVLTLTLGGCVLTGIEPDEIDVADEETGGAEADDDDPSPGDGDGDGDSTGSDEGDGDPGDGDGDPGDGDGDPAGDGDGDGDPGGDGDGDPTPCADFDPLVVVDGDNAIELVPGQSLVFGSCSDVDGPDLLLSYTAVADGPVSFAVTESEFDALVILAGASCDPLDELVCAAKTAEADLQTGETIHIVVESNQADVGGSATLTITGP